MTTLARFADALVRALAATLLLSMLACVTLGVVFRQLNHPLAWSDELAQYLLVWTGLVGWIVATRRRSHIRINVFADRLPGPARKGLEILIQMSVIVFAAVLVRYSFGLMERTWDVELVSLPLTAAFLYLPIPAVGAALILQAVVEIVETVRGTAPALPAPEEALPL